MTQKMIRDVLKGVRQPPTAALLTCSPDSWAQLMGKLRETNPVLGAFVSDQLQALLGRPYCEAWRRQPELRDHVPAAANSEVES